MASFPDSERGVISASQLPLMRGFHAECVKIFRIGEEALGKFAYFRGFSRKNPLALSVLKNFSNND
jgi:hypothetical protein